MRNGQEGVFVVDSPVDVYNRSGGRVYNRVFFFFFRGGDSTKPRLKGRRRIIVTIIINNYR